MGGENMIKKRGLSFPKKKRKKSFSKTVDFKVCPISNFGKFCYAHTQSQHKVSKLQTEFVAACEMLRSCSRWEMFAVATAPHTGRKGPVIRALSGTSGAAHHKNSKPSVGIVREVNAQTGGA
jgi:hypothetical protein